MRSLCSYHLVTLLSIGLASIHLDKYFVLFYYEKKHRQFLMVKKKWSFFFIIDATVSNELGRVMFFSFILFFLLFIYTHFHFFTYFEISNLLQQDFSTIHICVKSGTTNTDVARSCSLFPDETVHEFNPRLACRHRSINTWEILVYMTAILLSLYVVAWCHGCKSEVWAWKVCYE